MNCREKINESIENNLSDVLNRETEDKFNLRYIGKVVDNKDPEKNGRCRIRVFGIYGDEIQDKELPWAMPEFSFVGSKIGSFIVPPKDAIVRVYFDNGEIYLPIYTTKVIDENNLSNQKNTDYPDNMVLFETDEGDYLTINRKSKETKFKHNSGTILTFKKDGTVEMDIKKNIDIKVNGSADIDVTGSAKVNALSVELTSQTNTVIPADSGGFNCLKSCLFAGSLHVGTKMM